MIRSTIYAKWAIKVGLTVVFLWFGIEKFFEPELWVDSGIVDTISKYSITAHQFVYICGIFEVLAALSFITGVFLRVFAPLSILFLLGAMIVFGWTWDTAIYRIGLISGVLALTLWPENRNNI